MRKQDESNGWTESAQAWIEAVDRGDDNRELILDPLMLRLAGDVQTLKVVDVGCGEGRFCRMLAERGAETTGIDPTPPFITAARQRAAGDPKQHYILAPAETLPLPTAEFDLVISYVALVDIPGYQKAIAEMSRILRPGGRILVANTNFASAGPLTGWKRDEAGNKLYYPIDNYMTERHHRLAWDDIEIVNWHRPISFYMQAFLDNDLLLREYIEPLPDAAALQRRPDFADFFRLAYFVVMVWEKPAL